MYRILIAEDELIERMMLKKTLEKRFGDVCQVIETENGRKALEVFNSMDISVVILDIEMPVLKGIDAAEIMRGQNEDFPLIFLTAYDEFTYAKRAIGVHAFEYLLKPYSERELVAVVEKALNQVERNHQINAFRGHRGGDCIEERIHLKTDSLEECEGRAAVMPEEEENASRLNVLVSLVEEYIRSNYMYDISMQDAARAINYSEPYFCKMFKQQFGLNFTAYITEYRMEEARKLLMLPNASVKEVGKKVGYPDASYFARVFRRIVGQTPTEYRMKILNELS